MRGQITKGGERAAVIYSLIATCKLQGVEPFEYLRDVLTRLPEHPHGRAHAARLECCAIERHVKLSTLTTSSAPALA